MIAFSKSDRLLISCLWFAGAVCLWGNELSAVVVDNSKSPHAPVKTVGYESVRWTDGFWAERLDVCFERSIPSMWHLMKEGTYKPFLEHFLIAAGDAEGGHHGAKWNDGDFYKWMEAAITSLEYTNDVEIEQAIETSIKAISRAQRADGYLHTPVLIAQRNGDPDAKPFQNRHAFEMYNMGHLMTTACVHYRATGKRSLLAVAEKAANFLEDAFRDPSPELARHAICPSHYMGFLELYRTTRNQRYLDAAKRFVAMRDLVVEGGDDNQDRLPLAEQREIAGHAVRANYLYAGVADLYAEIGGSEYLTTLESVWESMVRKKLYITGACGALYDGASPDGAYQQHLITRIHQAYGRNYQLPNTTAHNETCANIANVMWCWRMFLITEDGKYIDMLERALYNSVLSGISLRGTEYFYVNPLRVVEPLPTELRYPRTRQPFFTSLCCPPNLLRTIAEVGEYAFSRSDDTVWVNLYGSSELKTIIHESPLVLKQSTEYPWNGTIRIEIQECPGEEFAIKLRRPAWADSAMLTLNGQPFDNASNELGYLEARRAWQPGDVLELKLSMPAKLMLSHPLVEETSNQVAVQRGPIVYCLESADLPPNVKLQNVVVPAEIKLQHRFAADLLDGVVVVEGTALYKQEADWGDELYRELKPAKFEEFPLRLVPYYAWANRGPGEMSVWLPLR